jgi:hypothetical protein
MTTYQPPELTEIGSLHELTQSIITINKSGPNSDVLSFLNAPPIISVNGSGLGTTLSVIIKI